MDKESKEALEDNESLFYVVSTDYEVRHAVGLTFVVLLFVAFLMALYALVDVFHPVAIIDQATGKIKEVKDHWMLVRSLTLKVSGSLVGGLALGWGLLIFNHITPGDNLKRIGGSALACAIFFGLFAIALSNIWCYG
jgi:hypothetical protein